MLADVLPTGGLSREALHQYHVRLRSCMHTDIDVHMYMWCTYQACRVRTLATPGPQAKRVNHLGLPQAAAHHPQPRTAARASARPPRLGHMRRPWWRTRWPGLGHMRLCLTARVAPYTESLRRRMRIPVGRTLSRRRRHAYHVLRSCTPACAARMCGACVQRVCAQRVCANAAPYRCDVSAHGHRWPRSCHGVARLRRSCGVAVAWQPMPGRPEGSKQL